MGGGVFSVLRGGVLVLSFVLIAVGRVPWLRMNRTGFAFVGATLVVVTGLLPLEEALSAIDMRTIVLLLSMMIVSSNLTYAGFFDLVADWVILRGKSPLRLLALLMMCTAILSAFFVNDTVCVVITPFVLLLTERYGLPAVPYLIGLAVSANIGSAMTLVGNPQNMYIGAVSGIPFGRFFLRMVGPSLLSLAFAYGVVVLVYRKEFREVRWESPQGHVKRLRIYRPLLYKCYASMALLVILLMVGTSIVYAAMVAASVLLITRRIHPEKIFTQVDFSILTFFGGLFVLTKGVEATGILAALRGVETLLSLKGWVLAPLAAVLSNLVSNVPAVMLLSPMVERMSSETGWLVLSLASTYAGNLTLLGSVANLIVAERARSAGVLLTFMEYLKVGIPVTVVSLSVGTAWLFIR
ncbi:Citrate transporter [Spirochaeta thermophila DSM 6578]|uniref:Citrate transporter n=1 Tax=Winmispira thermophila (strain ATCC 700085 / DSM 6578 / Z-1203) TaxID=869211 RepID=G0GA58_WINT7|nr:anion transporter [Spirochaeta thermophila]AEJ60894.1 Citrate transporter [Spirochaeta thermophila DSM 6578]